MKQIIFVGSFILLFLLPYSAIAKLQHIAFYYGPNPPLNSLHNFDVVVLDPASHVPKHLLNTPSSKSYAYLSLGEINNRMQIKEKIPQRWLLGKNQAWHTKILDQTNRDWQHYVLDKIVSPLWQQGYHGFFLDTLDSYKLVVKDPAKWKAQQGGELHIIAAIKKHFPDAHIIVNRGFELFPKVKPFVDAVAAESLYRGWDHKRRYYKVKPKATDWLLGKLQNLQQQGLPIIVIDYLPAEQDALAHRLAKRIRKLGFVPWITNAALDRIGISTLTPVKRQVLVIYNAKESPSLQLTSAVQFVAMPLEYLGYVPHYIDVNKPLPSGNLSDRYAGIVVWLGSDFDGVKQHLQRWLELQIQHKLPIAIFNHFGFPLSATLPKLWQLHYQRVQGVTKSPRIIHQTSMLGFEIKPFPQAFQFTALKNLSGKTQLSLRESRKLTSDPVAITSWGGYAITPYDIMQLPNGQQRWVINPFQFLHEALRLPARPIADTTTENGRRLLMAHIDGDGFVSRAEWLSNTVAGQVMLDDILKRYKIPTTVSIIQGEIAANGLYPKQSSELQKIARGIFKLPWVEIASHTYSHPFDWSAVIHSPDKGYHLAIQNYRYQLRQEIMGSVNYIDNALSPKDKRCKVFLWSGVANPGKKALALCQREHLFNMNGGDTQATKENATLTAVSALGIPLGQYFQVFAPVMNENIYTNEWKGPYWGFQRVIETFEFTNTPRRLKPIDIYYHFYSATKRAALKALNKVYDWALSQATLPIFISEYCQIVNDFNHLSIAREGSTWRIHSKGHLRELRVPQKLGIPDLKDSVNIVGYRPSHKSWYVHLGPRPTSKLMFMQRKNRLPYLYETNARLSYFKREHKALRLGLITQLPMTLVMKNMKRCRLYAGNHLVYAKLENNGLYEYKIQAKDSDAIKITC